MRSRLPAGALTHATWCVLSLALLTACGERNDSVVDTGAVATAASTPGEANLANYELTMEQVDQYFAAFRNIAVAMQRMTPAEREGLDLDASDADFDGYVARLEGHPALDRAIRDAGLTAREFSLVLWSMLQAGMANAVIQSQPDANEDSLAAEMRVNVQNVRFIREHDADIRQKQEALDAEMRKMELVDTSQ
jgi:hypothetical protein